MKNNLEKIELVVSCWNADSDIYCKMMELTSDNNKKVRHKIFLKNNGKRFFAGTNISLASEKIIHFEKVDIKNIHLFEKLNELLKLRELLTDFEFDRLNKYNYNCEINSICLEIYNNCELCDKVKFNDFKSCLIY